MVAVRSARTVPDWNGGEGGGPGKRGDGSVPGQRSTGEFPTDSTPTGSVDSVNGSR